MLDLVMTVIVSVAVLAGRTGLFYLGRRWTQPRPVASDLRRADDAETDGAGPETMRERVMNYITMFGPNNT